MPGHAKTRRTLSFAPPDGDGPSVELPFWCRSPPEGNQAAKTLTLRTEVEAAQPAAQLEADLIGADVWPASLALCRHLAAHPALVAGARAIELGCGTGLPGLLAARLGAAHVCFSDYEPQVLELARANAELNGVLGASCFLRLDFRAVDSLAPAQRRAWRLVLAADVLYATCIAAPLADTLDALLHPEGVALLAHQTRRAVLLDPQTRLPRLEDSDAPYEVFVRAAEARGLAIKVLRRGAGLACSGYTALGPDPDPMVLLALARDARLLEALPAGAGGGEGAPAMGSRQAAAGGARDDSGGLHHP